MPTSSRSLLIGRCFLLGAALAALASQVRAEEGAGGRSRAFALTNSRDQSLAALLAHEHIDGVALQESWAAIETQPGSFSWASLDLAIGAARAVGKEVSLHLLASPRAPAWLANVGAAFYSGRDFQGQPVHDVVPWDSVYLQRFSDFLLAVADHLEDERTLDSVFDVSVVVPVPEMNLVACRDGRLGDSVPYDRAAYLAAWKRMVDAYYRAFPRAAKFVSPPVNGLICAPTVDKELYREVMDYAIDTYDDSFWVFAADLNADGSQRTRDYLDDVASRTSLGYQTIWSATSDPNRRMGGSYPTNLEQAVGIGLSHGATYFEIYAVDVLNPEPAIQRAVTAAHSPADDGVLPLAGGRFEVRTTWTSTDGDSGVGHARALTTSTGAFWFFDEDNLEVVVKVLDACAGFGRFWVFGAGLTNLRVETTVTDTETGVSKTYVNPQKRAFRPIRDTSTFATCP